MVQPAQIIHSSQPVLLDRSALLKVRNLSYSKVSYGLAFMAAWPTDKKGGTDKWSLLNVTTISGMTKPRSVAPSCFIRRRSRGSGCFTDRQHILLATEENLRQGLVTGLVGAG